MSLECKSAKCRGRELGARYGGEGGGPRGAEVYLVHAAPCSALLAVDHDAVVTCESEDERTSEGVAIQGSDYGDLEVMKLSGYSVREVGIDTH